MVLALLAIGLNEGEKVRRKYKKRQQAKEDERKALSDRHDELLTTAQNSIQAAPDPLFRSNVAEEVELPSEAPPRYSSVSGPSHTAQVPNTFDQILEQRSEQTSSWQSHRPIPASTTHRLYMDGGVRAWSPSVSSRQSEIPVQGKWVWVPEDAANPSGLDEPAIMELPADKSSHQSLTPRGMPLIELESPETGYPTSNYESDTSQERQCVRTK